MRVFQNYPELTRAFNAPEGSSDAFRWFPRFGPSGFRCADCDAVISFDFNSCTSNYSIGRDNFTMRCIPCTDNRQLSEMRVNDIFTGYLSGDGKRFTTWTGGTLGRVISERESRTGFHRSTLTHIRVIDALGAQWHGKGSGRGMCVTVRRCKGA